jgi:predicted unusual protein kinase regulating ubiquinone biosynthesis (AarF/ABC1/UbiB family)
MITSLQRGLVALLIICWLSMTQGFLMQISKRTGSLGTSALVISAATRMANNGETLSEKADAPAALTEPPLVRAIEIVSIVCGTVLSPLIASLLTYGFPSNWDAFWARSIGEYTHGQRIALTAEQLGPTYVKFCQALSSRPDIVPKSLAEALQTLQDDMKPIDADTAKEIIRDELNGVMRSDELKLFLDSLSKEPVGAASIGVVFKGLLPGYGEVAVKVKRRGIRELVERDAHLLRSLASWLESIPAIPLMNKDKGLKRNRLISTELVDAVEEFFSRIFEELDYRNEAANCQDFGRLYSDRGESTAKIRVVVPEIMPHLCTDNVLVMEWVNGTKLTDVDRNDPETLKENLEIIAIGIECTLSQLLDTGVSFLSKTGYKYPHIFTHFSLLI